MPKSMFFNERAGKHIGTYGTYGLYNNNGSFFCNCCGEKVDR